MEKDVKGLLSDKVYDVLKVVVEKVIPIAVIIAYVVGLAINNVAVMTIATAVGGVGYQLAKTLRVSTAIYYQVKDVVPIKDIENESVGTE